MQELGSGEATVFGHKQNARAARCDAAQRPADPRPRFRRHACTRRDPFDGERVARASSVSPSARTRAAPICSPPISARWKYRRASASAAKSGFHKAGFHPTGLVGAFGCSLAAARLLGLRWSRRSMRRASCCRWRRAAWNSCKTARGPSACIRAGRRSRARPAATLAKHGFIGPGAAYEGRFGLYALHLNDGARRRRSRRSRPRASARRGKSTASRSSRFPHATSRMRRPMPPSRCIAHMVSQATRSSSVIVRVPGPTSTIVCEPVGRSKKPGEQLRRAVQHSLHRRDGPAA